MDILALDRVLVIEGAWKLGLTPEDGWSESLAVLTHNHLYLLEPSDPEPLSPFGRTWRRIQLTDVSDLTVSSISGAAGAEMLRISINAIFQGDILLRTPPYAADVSSWVGALEPVIAAARTRLAVSSEVPDSVAACLLGQQRLSRHSSQERLISDVRWWEPHGGRTREGGSGRSSPVSEATSSLTRRRWALAAGSARGIGIESGGVRNTSTTTGLVMSACGDGASGIMPSKPWATDWLCNIHAMGVLDKRRDGFWRVGWAERLFVLWMDNAGSAHLLYYKRAVENNDELLGELRGVIDLRGASIELRSFEDGDDHHQKATSSAGTDGRRSYLRITAAQPAVVEPFYVLPKRLAVIDVRSGGSCTDDEELKRWEERIRWAVRRASGALGVLSSDKPIDDTKADGTDDCRNSKQLRNFRGGWVGIMTLGGLNACLLLARSGSESTFIIAIVLANALCYLLLWAPRATSSAPRVAPLMPLDRKLSRSERPRAGMVCGDPMVLAAPLACNGDARDFSVRCGPDYPRLGLKAPSQPAMYELLSSDFGRASQQPRHVAELMQLPSPPSVVQGRLPPLLVVNVVVPIAAPSLLGEKDDNGCVAAILCFGATDSAQASSRESSPPPAVELLAKFNENAAEKRMDAGVFKVSSIVWWSLPRERASNGFWAYSSTHRTADISGHCQGR